MLLTWLENVTPRWPTARTFRRGEVATNSVAAPGGPARPVMQVRTAARPSHLPRRVIRLRTQTDENACEVTDRRLNFC
jgi:hypothetical protein